MRTTIVVRCCRLGLLLGLLGLTWADVRAAGLRAGASRVDVSPTMFPVLINGGFLQAQTMQVKAPLYARALVLEQGTTRLALVVVDSCMMPRDLIDRAKVLAERSTGIAPDHMLISATHTHSAPAAMGALGCSADGAYVAMLPERLASAIEQAAAHLAPAKVGWGSASLPEYTHCRRWIRRPDRMVVDPFGRPTGRAHMHPGHQNPDAITPSGPVDPQLSVLAVKSDEGQPIALLANFSMHYYGDEPASPDYFGRFAEEVARRLRRDGQGRDFVAMMSQGTSGDQQWMDYSAPTPKRDLDAYANALTESAVKIYESIEFRDDAQLAMAETTLRLGRRVPDAERLAWARPIAEALKDQPPRTIPEVYAREAIHLHDDPVRELKLQAIRIGDLGIAAIPNEVYALTGLKIKARSPLASTFTIELANGSEGYIPPPEQHALGGYTTWPARTAALEVPAETKITDTVLSLLERVAKAPRRLEAPPTDPHSTSILAAKPWAFWRLEDMDGHVARDASGHARHATLEFPFALFLDGRREGSRAVYLAGGSLALGTAPPERATVELWFWNGLPNALRPVTGTLLEFGSTLSIAVGGRVSGPGRLVVSDRSGRPVAVGGPEIAEKQWHHLAVVRDVARIAVILDGRPVFEGLGLSPAGSAARNLVVGGGSDPGSRFDGKIDDVALFDRVLSQDEIRGHIDAGRSR